MKYLTVSDVRYIHQRIIRDTGGDDTLISKDSLASSVQQVHQTFEGEDLYPELEDKAAALCYFLIKNHPFSDGNKRVGYNAMEIFLLLNGKKIRADTDELEEIIFGLAAGDVGKVEFFDWVRSHTIESE